MWALSLFAHLLADERDDPLMRAEVVWGVLGLTGALLVGAAVIYAVDKWRKRSAVGATESDTVGELTGFRAMYENGEITEAEYAELRRRVAERVKKPAPKPPGVEPARGPGIDPSALAALTGSSPPPPPPPPPAGPTESLPPPSTA